MPIIHVITSSGKIFDHPIGQQPQTIGRSKDCDIPLPDNTVSRAHVQIKKTRDGYLLTDLGSFNGTRLNGASVQSAVLQHEDVIEIGQTRITFLIGSSDNAAIASSIFSGAENIDDEQQVVGRSPQIGSQEPEKLLVSLESQKSATPSRLAGAPECQELDSKMRADISSLERTNKVLFILYEISRELNGIQDFKALLDKIMDLIFQVINADFGFLILTGGLQGDELIPMVVKYKDESLKAMGQIRASRTIINRVIHDKVALLTSNAMDDSRLDSAKSVFIQQIRSAMCVPLWNRDEIIGVIQLDSVRFENQFVADDLELLKAIGSQMAMIIEQASLNEKIREESKMRSRLERFHSPQIIEMILHGGQEDLMEPKDLTATILFSDIVGFTTLSESLPPREINIVLNQYFTRMTDILFKHDGTLDKYIGDGLMAVFGAPMEKPDDAERAIQAALEMRRELAAMRDEVGSNSAQLHIRIGINTGRVVAGNMGSPRRLDYTVIGDPVNLAARLESSGTPNQILIGEETYKLVKGKFNIVEVGPRKVKGKAAEIMVYEVIE